MRVKILSAAVLAACLVSACGGEQADSGGAAGADPVSDGAGIAATAAKDGDAPIEGTREEVEQAHKCRGVMSAAFAARTVMKDSLPADVAGMTSDTAMYWTDRAARLRAPGMTEAELDALTASSVRVLASPMALENALPEIRACLAAQAKG